jgi:hypothetical protein
MLKILMIKFFLFGKFLLTYRGVFLYFSLGSLLFLFDFSHFSQERRFLAALMWILLHIFWTDWAVRRVSVVALVLLFAESMVWGAEQLPGALYGSAFLAWVGLFVKAGARYVFKKEGLGWGDVVLLGISGIWVPLTMGPLFLIMVGSGGALWGLMQSKSRHNIPLASVISLCLAYYILIFLHKGS